MALSEGERPSAHRYWESLALFDKVKDVKDARLTVGSSVAKRIKIESNRCYEL
ncbi:conserved hypothetical protein [Ricinus communis]|uniref:Uncharacterized protein n=1 Tax=Ricinus communis TaxID=3988 RepID=B9T367_RICCO|nr:conserved hypothetical protein [Ricinus communis]